MLKRHWQYLKYVVRHKFWVGYYCFKEGLIWRGLIHDLSKFKPSEWLPYANYFFGPKGDQAREIREGSSGYYKPYDTGDESFDFAWFLHQKHNDHHWQWWVFPKDDGSFKALPMKEQAWREMICDWRGAGRAQGYGDNTVEWYHENKQKMILHDETRWNVEFKLAAIYGKEKLPDLHI